MKALATSALLVLLVALFANPMLIVAAGPDQPKTKDPSGLPVRLLATWHRPPPDFGVLLIIRNADELAKALPDRETIADIRNKVTFAKERLVAFSRRGGSGGTMTPKVVKTEKGREVTFRYFAGEATDKALNSFLFAVPNDVTFVDPVRPAPRDME